MLQMDVFTLNYSFKLNIFENLWLKSHGTLTINLSKMNHYLTTFYILFNIPF
ncbi:hypothetical protein HNR27_000619 [Ornithinibacillus bavariensis]